MEDENLQAPAEEPKEPNQPPAEEVIPAVDPTVEELKKLRETVEETAKIIGSLNSTVRGMQEKHAREIEELRSSLPKITVDAKSVVEGYFDYDLRADRMLHEEARTDYDRAKSDFAMLKTIFR